MNKRGNETKKVSILFRGKEKTSKGGGMFHSDSMAAGFVVCNPTFVYVRGTFYFVGQYPLF